MRNFHDKPDVLFHKCAIMMWFQVGNGRECLLSIAVMVYCSSSSISHDVSCMHEWEDVYSSVLYFGGIQIAVCSFSRSALLGADACAPNTIYSYWRCALLSQAPCFVWSTKPIKPLVKLKALRSNPCAHKRLYQYWFRGRPRLVPGITTFASDSDSQFG